MGNIWAFLQQTGAAAITALFLLVLQRIFLRHLSPRWQYGVWSVLLLRLVVPVRVGYRSAYLDIAPWIERLRTWTELRLSSRYASPWQETLPRFPWLELPVQAPASVTDWLFVLYTAGVVLCVIWYGLQALRLHLRVREGVPVAGERLQRMKETAEGYGLSMPQRVVECRWTATPFLMGVFRPTLVLPMEWDMEEKVLLHELLHLKYQDVLAGWVTTLFRCLHWCNPILWLAFDKIGNDRECLCDQRVLERLEGEERRDYGRVLLSMADNRSIRIPGATTMANGARSVAARIQAIARFKRYPQGMTLVSVCITLSLAYALVAGTPIQALVQESGGTVFAPSSMAGALSTGQLNRPTTVAGALDTYGKGVLLKYDDPYTALLCAAMTAPEENLPALVEQWKKTDDLERSRWTTGPQFRGLVSDGSGGYLCQALWYRDMPEALLGTEEHPLPEEGEPWPAEYLCHTLWIRPDGQFWTVARLDEAQGELPAAPLSMEPSYNVFPGPVTWVGEADGVKLSLSPAQLLETGGGILGKEYMVDWSSSDAGGFWMFGDSKTAPNKEPIPGADFCSVYTGTYWAAEETGGQPISITWKATPLWNTPDGPAPAQPGRRIAAGKLDEVVTLAAGGSQQGADGGGGSMGNLGSDLGYMLGPDAVQVTVVLDGRTEQTIPMTLTYTTPDGGTYTFPGEEDAP